MGLRIACLLIAGALMGCGSQADRQLEAVKSARSVLAEWALVEERHDRGLAPDTYVEQMRHLSREQLEVSEGELTGQPQAAALIRQLRTGQPGAEALERADAALQPLEDRLESA